QEEGKQKLLKVIDITTKQFGERHSNLAKAYCKLAIFDLVQKEYESAEKKLLQAYDLYEQLPKIYIDHLTTLIKLIEVCKHFNYKERVLLYAEKFYQYAEMIQPSLFLDALTCFLEAAMAQNNYKSVLSHINAISTKIVNLNSSYPIEEIEHLDYTALKEILKIRKIEQKFLEVQIIAYLSDNNKNTQIVNALSQLVVNYKQKSDELSKRGNAYGPDLIAIINNYSELIDDGKHLLNEIHTQLVPKDKLEIALFNVEKLESTFNTFNTEQYLRDALLKSSIDNVSEEEIKQLLDLSGQFTTTIDMAIAYISISESKSIKEYCSFLSPLKDTFRINHPDLKNDACLNSFIIYCYNKVSFISTISNNIDLVKNIFYFIYLIRDKAPTAFFLFILIKCGFSKENSNQILQNLFELKFLKSENETILITSFVKALLDHEFNDLRLPVIKIFIEVCSQYIEINKSDSESILVMDIYRHTLLKFHDWIISDQTIENIDIVFVANHIYRLSSIYDDLTRFDQKTFLELLLNLYCRFNLDKNTESYAETLTLLAFSKRNATNYHRHLELIQEAHAIKSKLYKNDDPLFAKSLLNLARAFGDIKNTTKQIELGKEGLSILEKDYNLCQDTLDAEIRAEKEVDIVNAFINLAAGYTWVDGTYRIELLEQ
ncbi:33105_t:CDS:1, partial [Racocetra persica]